MKSIVVTITFLLVPIWVFTQVVKIKGTVLDYKTLQPMKFAEVVFNDKCKTIADDKGIFELDASKEIISDTLKIRYLGYFKINIINLPSNDNVIDLGIIPMFEYFPGYDMSDFDCANDDFECKKKWKNHIEQEQKRIEDYYSNVHNAVNYFEYSFQNKVYKIDVKTGCIDLKTEKKL